MAATTSAVLMGVGAVANFAQAYREGKKLKELEKQGSEMYKQMVETTTYNPYKSIGINDEAYREMRANLLQSAATAMEGVREGGGDVGRILQAQLKGERTIAQEKRGEEVGLDKLVAEQDAENKEREAGYMETSMRGIQEAANEARRNRNRLIESGIVGAGQAVGLGIDAMPLYRKTRQAKYASELGTGDRTILGQKLEGYGKEGVDISGVGDMSENETITWLMDNYTKDELDAIINYQLEGQGDQGFKNPYAR